ncbi:MULTISPECIES: non-ribosomal peptide synthetase [unclassified Anabaena]|uniref:non-ribosomal peptide synthetase n=1 Tax=unclassified Anabaena TaxID=2619674 RepID=UPI0014487FB2|nr:MULTISPECIES: non-ribosomal peptide synthetase [unclassified Anabaena]MTJ10024.1 amino acid adenylation domain-containing protein [Anabaena sp. UHCC 0204]MTJ53552.1 amino acid adenylation domain-containing protein [Anabaena sp. UHCC 0253]
MLSQIQGFQLSPQQQHLWKFQQDSSIYRALGAVLIEGNLQIDVFKQALQKVVDRNEILRTRFYRSQGIKIPSQVINSSNAFLFTEDEFLENHNLDQVIDELLIEEKNQPCDLESGYLFSTKLVKTDNNQYILFLSLPSLCADIKTLNNLVAEISSCYTAILKGDDFLDEPLQYADIAAWLNELLAAEETNLGRKYWQKIDISTNRNCQLIHEKYPHETAKFQPQLIKLIIDEKLVIQIKEVANKYQTTTSVFLLSCWLILLWRLTGNSDLIIGTYFDGRNYDELKSSLGLFAKYLPLACNLEDEKCFYDVLNLVKELTSEMSDHQESFDWETAVNNQKQEIEKPFFSLCFEFIETPEKHIFGEISLSLYQHCVYLEPFEIKLSGVCSIDEKLKLEFHYDSSLFTQANIENIADQFATLLASVVENPQLNISRLDLLSQSEKQHLLIKFNHTKTPELPYNCIHDWFAVQCQQTPDNIAVIYENQKLTYQELNNSANQLAHYLQSLGVGTETLIGICIERSPLMVIAVLGILKVGAAYVPIDPNYPPERKAFILADTQMPLLLTQASLAADLQTNNITTICLDNDWYIINQQPQNNPIHNTNSHNLAYVIYTSGSTGKPKGTLISHSGLVNYLHWCTKTYKVDQGSGTLVHSSLGFDLTITSLFSPLVVGSQIELLPENQNIENLAQTLIQRNNLSLVKITPAHLELLSQQLSNQEVASRTNAFIIGGENLSTQHINFWRKFAPKTILINEYGPTETVVGCCIYQVSQQDSYLVGSIPIGYPIANTQLYVLDQYLQPVPKGVIGELYIGGAGLARGYLNQPELTAQKFIPHPFSNKPGARLYKTGDQVRFRIDGNLEFLGRLDDQVKLRGFRIELGEIESLLSLHPTVQDAVVMVREDVAGDQRLIAYLVVKPDYSLSISNLRSFLQERLPEYMIPTAFIPLEKLPLTSNGKVNKKILPAPEQLNSEVKESFIAPRNSLEEQLANIWAEVLRIDKVGIYNNFFSLGGHSLLVTQLISRMRDDIGVELVIQDVFNYPTVADLAVIVTQKLAQDIDEDILARSLAELEELSNADIQLINQG